MNSRNIPVIGWLVCVEGADKGMDFPLINSPVGNGFGSDESMAVVVRDDLHVASANHAMIRFDETFGKCYLTQGYGKRIVRLNNVVVVGTAYLKPYDRIDFAGMEYVFIPCGGMIDPSNTWQRIKNKQPHLDVLTELADCVASPCVGWLVDHGAERNGVSYRLTSDYNYICPNGYADGLVISDNAGPGESPAAIIYDSRENKYMFMTLMQNAGCYINGMPVNGIATLNGYEEITVGMLRFCFIPLCGEFFRW